MFYETFKFLIKLAAIILLSSIGGPIGFAIVLIGFIIYLIIAFIKLLSRNKYEK